VRLVGDAEDKEAVCSYDEDYEVAPDLAVGYVESYSYGAGVTLHCISLPVVPST